MIDLTGNYFLVDTDFLIFLTEIIVLRKNGYDGEIIGHSVHPISDVKTSKEFAKTRGWSWVNE